MSQRSGISSAEREKKDAPVQPKDAAQSKQAMLLSEATGHFSLVRAMHLADLITEMNGK